jgi:serine/threonine-protein kinase
VDGRLRKVPVGGGSAITLTDSVQTGLQSAAWLDDGTLVYTDLSWRLRRLLDVGGPSEVVFTPEMGLGAYLPTAIPGGRGVLFAVCRVGSQCQAREEAWVLDLRTGEARMLMSDIARSWYVATGHVVYVRPDGSVFAVPFDLGSLEMRGAPVPILEGVQVERGTSPDFALSETGALLMVAGPGLGEGEEAKVVSVDRSGDATPVDQNWTFVAAAFQGIAVSPDGTRLAVNVGEEVGEDIWVKQLDGGPVSRVTFHDAQDSRPRWTPDGQSLVFISQRAGAMDLYVKPADGTGSAEILLDLDPDINEGVWSPDGTWLVIRTGGLASGAPGNRDIWGIRPGIDSVPLPLVAAEWDEKALALSPDGKWLAYESNESGTDEVYVRPFPDTEAGKWQVSTDGGTAPVWAHSGRELFYVKPSDGRTMMVAAVETEPTFSVGERRALFPLGGEYWLSGQYAAYDVALDDEHFFLVRRRALGDERVAGTLIIVDNWFEELMAKVGN